MIICYQLYLIIKSMSKKTEEEEILYKYYEKYQENYLPTPNESYVTSLI